MEFLWPLTGSGPFYKRIAEFNLSKCTANWWRNLLFINNYSIDPTDICAGHTFWSSVDFQLFLLGLVALILFSRSVRAGVAFVITLSALANLKIMYNAYMYETTPTLYVHNPISVKIPQYLGYIHMQTAVYLPAYFTGFLFSYALNHMDLIRRINLDSVTKHLILLIVTQGLFLMIPLNNALVNVFEIVPFWFTPVMLVLNRNIMTLACALMILHLLALKPVYEKYFGQQEHVEPEQHEQKSFSLARFLTRLTFPIYVCNYLVVRSEFFNRRYLEDTGLFWMVKRSLSTLVILYVIAFAYQILFLSPLDSVRQILLGSNPRSTKDSSSHAKGG